MVPLFLLKIEHERAGSRDINGISERRNLGRRPKASGLQYESRRSTSERTGNARARNKPGLKN